jgi:Protein of unknown function (DUF3179)
VKPPGKGFSLLGSDCPLPGAEIYVGPFTPDWCLPLDEPTWVKPDQATLMRDDDAVLGFEAVGQTWAIPWWVMKNHHIANLTLEREPFLVTLCEYCAGGGVFDPVLDGERFRFRVYGDYGGVPLMVDDVTGSLWWMVNTQPLQGPALELGRLPKRPIVHTTWDEWRAMFPETWIAHGEGEPRDGHGSKHLRPDHQDRELGVKKGISDDSGIDPLDLVVGVEIGASSRAYALSDVHAAGGIVEDVLASRPIVVVARPGSWAAVAFERELHGRRLELEWDASDPFRAHLVDAPTGSRFDLWGMCVEGPLEGSRLTYVVSALKKWKSWRMTNPNSEVWRFRTSSGAAESDHPPSRPRPSSPVDLKSLCLVLGRFGNFQDVMAAILYLHPACQVLNNGAVYVLPQTSLNFLRDYDDSKFDRFSKFALEISQAGDTGVGGGSIALSTAFHAGELADAFRRRYGEFPHKRRVECLAWKDPALTWFLREREVDVGELLDRNDKIRFLMPIRNPLLSAPISRLPVRDGGFKNMDSRQMLREKLEELAWFRVLGQSVPDRFLTVLADEIDNASLRTLCEFLSIEPDDIWIDDVLRSLESEEPEGPEPDLIDDYRALVHELFTDDAEMARKLEHLLPSGHR